MKTIAFYSYKGGVGRTLAVAHVAYWLSKQGKTVFMLDMDMEAPGLHYKLEKYSKPVQPDLGLVDYIGHFLRENKGVPSLEPFVIRLEPREARRPDAWLMPAGNPFRDEYWSQLNQVIWKEFLYGEDRPGALLFLELKAHIEKAYNPDYLLIDSRTGITDLTGIGLELLADDAVVLGANNQENIDGSRIVLERLRRREKLPFREAKTKIHFVLTRIPSPDTKMDVEREEKLTAKVKDQLNEGSGLASGPLISKVHVIHIDPEQAIEERNRFMETDWGQYPILWDYQRLVFDITGLGMESDGLSFWDIYEDYRLEPDAATKRTLAMKLLDWKTDVAEQVFQKGHIAQDFLQENRLAIVHYSRAIELNPEHTVAYNNRGVAYFRLKDFPMAMVDYNKAIQINPENAFAHHNRGLTYSRLKDLPSAMIDYNKAIELNPEYANAYYNRGITYSGLKDFASAIIDYDKVIELNPEYALAYNNRGNAYFELRDFASAIVSYNKAIELNPEYPGVFNNRGQAHSNLKNFVSAIVDYTKVIELNPDNAKAYNNRAVSHYHLGNYDQAMIDVQKSLELNPNEATVLGTLAEIYSAQDNNDLFYENLQKALDRDPTQIKKLAPQTLARHEHEPRFQALLKKYKPQ